MRCRRLVRMFFATGMLACLCGGIAMPLRADDRHKCEDHVRKMNAKFMTAVERYGATSAKAQKARAKLQHAQKQCVNDEIERQNRNRKRVREQERRLADQQNKQR